MPDPRPRNSALTSAALLSPKGLDYLATSCADSAMEQQPNGGSRTTGTRAKTARDARRVEAESKAYEHRRAACAADVLSLLENYGGRASFAELLPIYHLHYRTKRAGGKYGRRRENASDFLRRMQNDGQITCTYAEDGTVIEARARQ